MKNVIQVKVFPISIITLILGGFFYLSNAAFPIAQAQQAFPDFKWPYDQSLGVQWSGGPHSWSTGRQLTATINNTRGSGLDFAYGGKTFDVLAMASGTVIKNKCGSGLGCIVAVRHDIGQSIMIYGHLQPNSNETAPDNQISEGTWISQGTTIGKAGKSGADAIHLHIEFRDGTSSCTADVDCGDVGQWSGNPISWDGRVFVDGYYVAGYCVQEGYNGDCTSQIYNYDGSAIQGSPHKAFGNFPFLDGGQTKITIASVHPSFTCASTTNCEINAADKSTLFAGKGEFSGGAYLPSTNVKVSQPSSTPTTSPSNGIELCDGINFGQLCQTFTYSGDNVCIYLGAMDNRSESVRFRGSYVGNYDAVMYGDSSCGTYNARYSQDVSDFGAQNNNFSSMRIERHQTGSWERNSNCGSDGVTFYEHPNYGGGCLHINGSGYLRALSDFNFDGMISSAQVRGNWVGYLWEHNDRAGNMIQITHDEPDLAGRSFDNAPSSADVEPLGTCKRQNMEVSPLNTGDISRLTTPNCGDGYFPGTEIQLVANPFPGYTFAYWSGNASGQNPSTSVLILGDSTAIANFVFSPTSTPTMTSTTTNTPTMTATPTPSSTPTNTSTNTPTATSTPTATDTATSTSTSTPTSTNTQTNTPTATPLPCSTAPNKPTLSSPANGATVSTVQAILDWPDVSCVTRYEVVVKQYSTTGITVDSQANLTSSGYTTSAVSRGRTYFWNIKACNNFGCNSSDWWSFAVSATSVSPTATSISNSIITPTITNTPSRTATITPSLTRTSTNTPTATSVGCSGVPIKPTLISPANGATISTLQVTLDWADVNCASWYEVVVKQYSATGITVDSRTNLTSSIYTTSAATRGRTYFWSARACNSFGCTSSDWWSFNVSVTAVYN